VRPEFRVRSATLTEPVPVSDEMAIVGIEMPNGRFQLLAGADLPSSADDLVEQQA
jgi:hypothetical protein